jgi:hypothetical protein
VRRHCCCKQRIYLTAGCSKKDGLLTHSTTTGISPTSPESAETASSPWDATFIGQGRSEEDLHPNLLTRSFFVIRSRISSTGGNETSTNRFEHGRDRCAENQKYRTCPLPSWYMERVVYTCCYRTTSSLVFVVATPSNNSLNNTRTLLTDMSCKLSLVSILYSTPIGVQ